MLKLLENGNIIIVLSTLIFSLFILLKFSNILVDNAVKLSKIFGLSEIIIGATIVSLGTTIPEFFTSITSALQGKGEFAISNAIGSVITNITLIVGAGALYGNIPVNKKVSQKFSFLIFSVFLFIIFTIKDRFNSINIFISQKIGFLLILLIPIYIIILIKQNRNSEENTIQKTNQKKSKLTVLIIFLKITISAFAVAVSSSILVGSSEIFAQKIGIPDFIIAATLIAFGTSLPELTTCISAARKHHGSLAVGNIIGANILNVIMVIGAAISLNHEGMNISNAFYDLNIIPLILALTIFSYFAYNTKIDNITKKEGKILITIYLIYLMANIIFAF